MDSRSAARRDNAANANPSVFERLRSKAGAFKRRCDAPWNSRSEAACPASPEVQIGECPRLPNGQNFTLKHRKLPDRRQNIVRTFRVFYGRRLGPYAQS